MKKGFLILISLSIGLGLAEAALSIAFRYHQGTWSREPQKSYRRSLVTEEDFRLGEASMTNELHPLWGFSYNPRSPGVNSFGFQTPYAFEMGPDGYALKGFPREKTIVVGIFGGSMADLTARMARVYLEEKLRARYPGKIPVVVNFAIGGHSLPQALHIFLYFKEMVNVAVFIDGVNELWNTVDNNRYGRPPEYAKAAHFLFRAQVADLSVKNLIRTAGVLGRRLWLAHATRLSLAPALQDFLTVHMAWRAMEKVLKSVITEESRQIAASYERPPFFSSTFERLLLFAARRWENHHRLIHEISQKQGIADFHFLQPNPFAGHKTLTPGEAKGIERFSFLRRYVENGYPLLVSAHQRLRHLGLRGKNLVDLFDAEHGEIWDDGGHYNEAGGRRVVDEILNQVSWQRVADVKGAVAADTESGINP